MKKSVILIIGVIYILAIVIVGFIGIRMRVYNEKVYIDSIICESDGFEKFENNPDYDGQIKTTFETGLKVLVKCDYNPKEANAFDPGHPFKFTSSTSNDYKISENPDGKTCTIEFFKPSTCNLTVKATDNHGFSIKIKVTALPSDTCEIWGIC